MNLTSFSCRDATEIILKPDRAINYTVKLNWSLGDI
jgi:hypothetical protein